MIVLKTENAIEDTDLAFEHWLESKPEHTEVGIAGQTRDCPLAHYLNEKTQHLWSVNTSYYKNIEEFSAEQNWKDTPNWAATFIWEIDEASPFGVCITKERALKTLQESREKDKKEKEQEQHV